MGWSETLVKIIFWPRVRKARRIGRAAELIGEGRAEETLEILARMERRIPPYLGFLFFLTKARALDELGRLEEAEQAYLAAVFAKQGANTAYLHLAVLCGRGHRYDEARDWLRRIREDPEPEPELLEQADELETLLDDVESGRRLEEMRARAERFAGDRGVGDLPAAEALARLDVWASDEPERAEEERDELACYLGELAAAELGAEWEVNLNLEESRLVLGERRIDPFGAVAARLADGVELEGFLEGEEGEPEEETPA